MADRDDGGELVVTAAEDVAGDAEPRELQPRRRQSERCELAVHVAPDRLSLDVHGASGRVHPHPTEVS
jgi:hypothetical protein